MVGCLMRDFQDGGNREKEKNSQHSTISCNRKKHEETGTAMEWASLGGNRNVREPGSSNKSSPPPPSLTPLFRGSVVFIEGISLSIIAVYANITNSLRAGSLIWEILARYPNATEKLEHTGPTFLSCSSFPANLVINPLV